MKYLRLLCMLILFGQIQGCAFFAGAAAGAAGAEAIEEHEEHDDD